MESPFVGALIGVPDSIVSAVVGVPKFFVAVRADSF
jgi:hypothetical protein